MSLKAADLGMLLRKKKPIYVTNTSGHKAIVVVNLRDPVGGVTALEQVPWQKVPWLLSDRYSRKTLSSSQDLRSRVASGVLTVLDPAFASEWADTPKTKKMLRLLRQPDINEDLAFQDGGGLIEPGTPTDDPGRNVGDVNARIVSILSNASVAPNNAKNQKRIIEKLEVLGDLSQTEIAYILQNTDNVPMVRTWAVSEMGQYAGAVVPGSDRLPVYDKTKAAKPARAKPAKAEIKPAKAPKKTPERTHQKPPKISDSRTERNRRLDEIISRLK